jgi:hypothetical protein
MDNVLKYFEFSAFFQDKSGAFSDHEIAYTELNSQHFLIFEKVDQQYNLYVSKYVDKKAIGNTQPEILELLITDYDKSNPSHRVAMRRYFE